MDHKTEVKDVKSKFGDKVPCDIGVTMTFSSKGTRNVYESLFIGMHQEIVPL